MSLPWGFMYAGAPSVIASLWRVDDESTARLMLAFYERVFHGGSPTDKLSALTEARMSIRESQPHPYFWSAFVYLGDPR